jgi:superfamily I DNA and RNA helicase
LEEFKGLNNSFKKKKIMNISENAEAILNEIEKKYASIDQKQKRI